MLQLTPKYPILTTAQQCVWPLRAELSCRDNWRVNIRKLSYGNCLGLSWRNIDANLHPILYGFGKSIEKLRTCHDSSNENYLHATVLYNPLIFRGPGNKLTLDPEYLEIDDNPALCKKVARLTVDNCYGQYGFISRAELRILHDIELSITGYANLGQAVNHFVNRLSVHAINDGTAISLFNCLQLKKPGVKIRSIMSKRKKNLLT
jgi:hypothetical protein